jgi:hypothetical protein
MITETNLKRKKWPSKEWNGFLTGSTGATLGWWWSTLRKRCVASGSFNVPGRTIASPPLQRRRRCCSASTNPSIVTLYTACSCCWVPWLLDNTPIREFSMPGNGNVDFFKFLISNCYVINDSLKTYFNYQFSYRLSYF